MNLFKRKAHTVIMCNLMVPFVCTGFLGMKNSTGIITGNTTDEAHEISLTASDTEPVSQYGEGEDENAFIIESIDVVINQQESIEFLDDQIDDNVVAAFAEGIESIIDMQEEALSIDQEENEYAFVTQSIGAIIAQHEDYLSNLQKTNSAKKTTNTKKTNTVKKEVNYSTSYAKPSTNNASGDAIASYAQKFLGLPYKHYNQGTSLKTGTDCSGFTMLIYREFGISIPRTVSGQLARGTSVSKSNLQKGDLVFFKSKGCRNCGASHVSIYIGGGKVIHETRPGRGVAITGIDGLSNIQFYAARRIINSSNKKVVENIIEEKNKTDNTTATVNNDVTNETVTIDDKKNEIVDNNVVDNKEVNTTVTTDSSLEVKEETKTDTSQEEQVVETPKVEVETPKTEVEIPVSEPKKEESKEEIKETEVSNMESN